MFEPYTFGTGLSFSKIYEKDITDLQHSSYFGGSVKDIKSPLTKEERHTASISTI